MADLSLNEMQAIQKELQERYKNVWEPILPETGRNKLLWMMAEAGEVAEIIKKQGDGAIMNDPEVRREFVEEMCDVLMYFNDVLISYSITPEEFEKAYTEKHNKNMKRW